MVENRVKMGKSEVRRVIPVLTALGPKWGLVAEVDPKGKGLRSEEVPQAGSTGGSGAKSDAVRWPRLGGCGYSRGLQTWFMWPRFQEGLACKERHRP